MTKESIAVMIDTLERETRFLQFIQTAFNDERERVHTMLGELRQGLDEDSVISYSPPSPTGDTPPETPPTEDNPEQEEVSSEIYPCATCGEMPTCVKFDDCEKFMAWKRQQPEPEKPEKPEPGEKPLLPCHGCEHQKECQAVDDCEQIIAWKKDCNEIDNTADTEKGGEQE